VYGTVIVGFDGSDQAGDGLALGRLLSAVTGARLVAAAVYDGGGGLREALRGEWREQMRSEAEATLAEVGGGAERVAVDSSSAARGLDDLAERLGADLVVVGSCHRGRVGRVLAGSVGERLLQGAPCGVAIAPRGFAGGGAAAVGVVGVGYDGGPEARVALAGAVELARAAGASVRIIALVKPPERLGAKGGPVPAGEWAPLAGIRRDLQAAVDEALAEFPADVELSAELVTGASETLGEREGVDLLVVGSRGYGPMRRALLGSTSMPLVRHATYPLIVFPRGARAAGGGRPAAGAAAGGEGIPKR
jgi:nucleotide-binding universal stress UspA family protein